VRIVYLTPSAQVGGAERALLDLLAGVRAEHPEWHLTVVLNGAGPLRERVEELGVGAVMVPYPRALARLGDADAAGPRGWLGAVGRLGVAGPAVAAYVLRLRRALRGLAPDVVHSNGIKTHVVAGWVVPAGARVLWHVHDYLSSRRVVAPLLAATPRPAVVAAVSRSVADDFRALRRPSAPVHCVYNATDLCAFSPAGERLDLDARADLPPAAPGTVRIGLVSTGSRWKGQDVFLQALARLPAELPVRGYLIGGAIYETRSGQFSTGELRAMAERLGLAGRVGFTGHLRDTAPALRGLDVVVHASVRPEPFGLVITEAMACARPVVVSRSGGPTEIVTEGVDGLAHDPRDVDALAAHLERLVRDPGLRERLGAEGRRTVEARFDRRRLGAEFARLYQQGPA
jgi:glycosyltransferase involved in cell wall biosynthesis